MLKKFPGWKEIKHREESKAGGWFDVILTAVCRWRWQEKVGEWKKGIPQSHFPGEGGYNFNGRVRGAFTC